MKVRLLLTLATGGLLVASLMLLSTSPAYAQCGTPNDPCPPEKEKKIKTEVPPTNTVPAPSSTPTATFQAPTLTPTATVLAAVLPPPPGGGTSPNASSSDFPGALGGGAWLGSLIGLLVGILIGMLLPAVSKSFFDRGHGKAGVVVQGGRVAGGGDLGVVVQGGRVAGGSTDPAGSFFDSQPDDLVGAKAPGPPQSPRDAASYPSNPEHSPRDAASFPHDPELSPRDAALRIREAALDAREAALNAREAALRGSTGAGTL